MTKDQIYKIWRSDDSIWCRWVRPVLFSYIGEKELQTTDTPARAWGIPPAGDSAVVVNLPGATGVVAGLALFVEGGYRPIPVYNACPYAAYDPGSDAPPSILEPVRLSFPAVVDVAPIMSALCGAAQYLAAGLPATAPPAFLIDENREGLFAPAEGWFDNRSFVTASDFPSATFFKAHGLSRVIIVQNGSKIQDDLRQVLLEWQTGGITVAQQEPWQEWNPRVIKVKTPSVFSRLAYWLVHRFGYRKDSSGWFGGLVRPSGG